MERKSAQQVKKRGHQGFASSVAAAVEVLLGRAGEGALVSFVSRDASLESSKPVPVSPATGFISLWPAERGLGAKRLSSSAARYWVSLEGGARTACSRLLAP